jgi:hypothetical protein
MAARNIGELALRQALANYARKTASKLEKANPSEETKQIIRDLENEADQLEKID